MSFIEIITLFVMMATLAALPSASVALVLMRSATLGIENGMLRLLVSSLATSYLLQWQYWGYL